MKRIKIQWSLLFLILIITSVASVFSAIKFFEPETPKRVISGSVLSNNDTSAVRAFDWMLMQSPGAAGNLIVIKPVRESQLPRSYEYLAANYQLKSNGIVFNDELIEIPEAGSRVIVDTESSICDVPVNTNRSIRAVSAVLQRNPTFSDLNYLYDRCVGEQKMSQVQSSREAGTGHE
jgi:hypothetical protein